MLGYIAGAAFWGLAKSSLTGARRTPHALLGFGFAELMEEVEFRAGIEHVGLRGFGGLSPGVSRLASSALFGLAHPGAELDAALGGVLYSMAYEKWGLLGSTLTHLGHNLGVYLGGQ